MIRLGHMIRTLPAGNGGIPTGDERRQASKDGYLIDAGSNVVPVASEEEAFRLIGSNYVFPEARDRMCESIKERRERA